MGNRTWIFEKSEKLAPHQLRRGRQAVTVPALGTKFMELSLATIQFTK
jgi:hypothetical protein